MTTIDPTLPAPAQTPPPASGAPDPVATSSVRRIMLTMIASYSGAFFGMSVPMGLLLTLHLVDMVGQDGVAVALSVVTGVGAVAALIVNPIAGRVSDRTRARFGRRRTWILAGGVIGALVVATIGFTSEVWQVVVLWGLAQVVFNFQLAATGALLPDQVPAERRGAISGMIGVTVAIVPLLGLALVVPFTGWVQWAITGAFAIACAVAAVVILRDPQPEGARPPLDLRSIVTAYWVNPRRHPAFGWAWAVRFLVTVAGGAGTYNGIYLMQQHGVTRDELSGVILVISIITVVIGGGACVAGGILSDKLQRQKPFVFISVLLSMGSLVVLAFAPNLGVVVAAMILGGIGGGVFLSVDLAMTTRMLPVAGDVGKDFAVLNLSNTLPGSFVPFIAPTLIAIGGFPMLYLTLAVAGVLGALCVLRLPELGREGDPRFAQLTVERRAER